MNIDFGSLYVAIPIIIGVTEVIKRTGVLPSSLSPLVALALGVVYTFIAPITIVMGVLVGLSASGLYKVGQSTGSAVKR